jgi:D-amino-acid dehydrogenase
MDAEFKEPVLCAAKIEQEPDRLGNEIHAFGHPGKSRKAAVPLRDIAIFSQKLYEDWTRLPQFKFAYQHKGLLEIFQTQAGADHAHHMVHKAHELGLLDTEMLNYDQLQQLEPHTKINAIGAVWFKCDAHVYPNKLMQQLIADLKQKGVQVDRQ